MEKQKFWGRLVRLLSRKLNGGGAGKVAWNRAGIWPGKMVRSFLEGFGAACEVTFQEAERGVCSKVAWDEERLAGEEGLELPGRF
jgi:hypothetical protein